MVCCAARDNAQALCAVNEWFFNQLPCVRLAIAVGEVQAVSNPLKLLQPWNVLSAYGLCGGFNDGCFVHLI